MLSEEAQRAASILHQTPGWRWRRKLCLTERTQQCQSGPTTKAWFHDRCYRVDSDACRGSNVTTRVRHRQSTCKKQCQNWRERRLPGGTVGRVRGIVRARAESTTTTAWKGWRVRVAPPGACGLHRQNEIHAGVDSIVSKNLADNGVATPRDTRAAPPGGVWVASSGRAWIATLKLDRPIVRVLPVHNDGGVSRYQD